MEGHYVTYVPLSNSTLIHTYYFSGHHYYHEQQVAIAAVIIRVYVRTVHTYVHGVQEVLHFGTRRDAAWHVSYRRILHLLTRELSCKSSRVVLFLLILQCVCLCAYV